MLANLPKIIIKFKNYHIILHFKYKSNISSLEKISKTFLFIQIYFSEFSKFQFLKLTS